jgi:hypothetical protein
MRLAVKSEAEGHDYVMITRLLQKMPGNLSFAGRGLFVEAGVCCLSCRFHDRFKTPGAGSVVKVRWM